MLLVAVAAILAWRVDKTRFDAAIANYGEELPDPEWQEIECANVAESFSIRDVAFVYLQDDMAVKNEPCIDLSDVAHPAKAELRGRPSNETMALVNQCLRLEHSLSFEDAKVIDYGDAGHYWRISWALYPTNAGFSGYPYHYIGFVRGDGSRVDPKIYLRDHFGSWYSNDGNTIYSVLSINSLTPADTSTVDETKMIELATEKLNEKLSELGVKTKFRFESIRREFSGKLKSIPVADKIEAWAVEFVDQAIPATTKNENSATKITIWVNAEMKTSEISVGSWSVAE